MRFFATNSLILSKSILDFVQHRQPKACKSNAKLEKGDVNPKDAGQHGQPRDVTNASNASSSTLGLIQQQKLVLIR